MTAITEGMTPAQFLTALNNNYTEYWGTGGVATILSTDGYITSINVNFGESTVAFGQSGTAFNNSLNKFNTFTHSLVESGEGADIDSTKWEVLNPDTGSVSFQQSKNITNKLTGITTNEKNLACVMNSLPAVSATLMYRNRMKSKIPFTTGAVTFDLLKVFKDLSRVYIGLFSTTNEALGHDDPNNAIYFYAYGANSWHFGIKKNGVEVYTLHDIARSYLRVQVVKTPANKISLYGLTNKSWVQLGVTQTQDLGDLYFCQSSEGYYAGQVSFREFWQTSRMFSTIRPGIANEASPFGVADGTTDNAGTINTALLSGDVYLKDGIFLISESIKNPSNAYVHLTNAVIKLADNALDNTWRNSDFVGGNVNVGIIGHGHAILDGNAENNDDQYETYSDLVAPETFDGHKDKITAETYRYYNILPITVNGFEFSGLSIVDHAHFNFNLEQARNGVVKNIFINRHFTTTPSNQDGFGSIGFGIENVDIYNIKSLSDDDFLCVFSCRPDYDQVQVGQTRSGDIKNVNVQDIEIYGSGGRCVIFIISEGNKLDGFRWSNIKQYSAYYNMLIGWPDYTLVAPVKDDLKNIIANNITVVANAQPSVFKVNQPCKNIAITNLTNNSGKPNIAFEAGLVAEDIENFTIEGVLQHP